MNDELGEETVADLLRTLERSGPPATELRRASLRAAVLAEYDIGAARPGDASTATGSGAEVGDRRSVLVEVELDPRERPTSRRRRWGGAAASAVAAALVALVLLRSDDPRTTTDESPAQPVPVDTAPASDEPAPMRFDLAGLTVEMALPSGLEVRSAAGDRVVVGRVGGDGSGETVTMVAVSPRPMDEMIASLVDTGDVSAARLQVVTASGPVDAWDLTVARTPDPASTCAAGVDCIDLYAGAPPEFSLDIGVNHRVALLEGDAGSSLLVMVRGARISEFSVLASALLTTVAVVS